MHILILGGGIAGLALAGLIDGTKHRVVVLEQDSPEEFAKKWNWYDNLNVAELRRLGYGGVLPDSFPEQGKRTIASLSGKFKLRFRIERPLSYEQVSRQSLLANLREKARENANLRYDTQAEALLIESGRVAGIILPDGREIRADLTIDCTGVSEISKPLPGGSFLAEEDTMTVFRGIFPHEKKDTPPTMDCVAVRPLGTKGVSRYSLDAADKADIFISRVGLAEANWAEGLLSNLLKQQSAWDEPDVPAGNWGEYKVPVRCPLTQMVFDGCALLGDSACMTSPFMGTGIVNALHGAKILAELINDGGGADMESLWKYQVRYYREAAKNTWRTDIMKRWLLKIPDELLERVFSSRIVSQQDAERIYTGRFFSLTPPDLLRRGLQLLPHPKLMISVLSMFSHAIWAEECGRSIPEEYNEKRVAAWQQRLARAME
ncbi:MAG: hypothetical protein LBT21_06125 [Oscillospiraceae bacterium]|jgi:2-polyprenyl-6-methoxyphenol hydroxylase-like FAD-dependent oxidoreductase|nr:hypothetical protein [Oscillospiraceae bacterium]